mmetsp:Transcript_31276/g.89729  ORF Transcript_31276/g.89729 Transcript_31276/m.89729 type:complete len:240 (-) Transcript_31276:1058-1777(-)
MTSSGVRISHKTIRLSTDGVTCGLQKCGRISLFWRVSGLFRIKSSGMKKSSQSSTNSLDFMPGWLKCASSSEKLWRHRLACASRRARRGRASAKFSAMTSFMGSAGSSMYFKQSNKLSCCVANVWASSCTSFSTSSRTILTVLTTFVMPSLSRMRVRFTMRNIGMKSCKRQTPVLYAASIWCSGTSSTPRTTPRKNNSKMKWRTSRDPFKLSLSLTESSLPSVSKSKPSARPRLVPPLR